MHHNGQVVKKIPWSAFQLTDADWERVKDAQDILKVRCLGYNLMPEEMTSY